MAHRAAVHVVAAQVDRSDHPVFERVRPRILPLVKGRAVPLVAARFQRQADCRPGAVAVLRVDRVLLHVHFLHHIRRGHVAGLVPDPHRGAVHLQVIGVVLAAADPLLVRSPTVVGHVFRSVIVFLHRRVQLGQKERSAEDLGQVVG